MNWRRAEWFILHSSYDILWLNTRLNIWAADYIDRSDANKADV